MEAFIGIGYTTPGSAYRSFVQLTRDAWLIWLRDSTSLKLIAVPLTTAILEKGVGPVGNVRIPPDMWRALVPGNFGELSRQSFSSLSPVTGQSAILARALVRQGVLRRCHADGLGPNGSLFPIPKNSEKVSCSAIWFFLIRPNGAAAPPPPPCDCLALSLWLFYRLCIGMSTWISFRTVVRGWWEII